MKIEDAKRIIEPIRAPNSARLDGELVDRERGSAGTVYWRPHNATAELEGNFTADELEAVSIWMRDNVDPTRE